MNSVLGTKKERSLKKNVRGAATGKKKNHEGGSARGKEDRSRERGNQRREELKERSGIESIREVIKMEGGYEG